MYFFLYFLVCRGVWCVLSASLALYYLNALSKGYQQANLDLKKKMQLVSPDL